MLPAQCCHAPEGVVIRGHGKMVDSLKDRENWKDLEKKICFCLLTVNPTKSHARFNCSYTVRRQHLTTWHQDSTIFIWNAHNKTVWTLHWYCIVQWHYNEYKILESMAINLQWVSTLPAPLINIWQIFKKNIRYNLHWNCKNMSAVLPLSFCALAVSSNYPL